jgi:hypothetical protein
MNEFDLQYLAIQKVHVDMFVATISLLATAITGLLSIRVRSIISECFRSPRSKVTIGMDTIGYTVRDETGMPVRTYEPSRKAVARGR